MIYGIKLIKNSSGWNTDAWIGIAHWLKPVVPNCPQWMFSTEDINVEHTHLRKVNTVNPDCVYRVEEYK